MGCFLRRRDLPCSCRLPNGTDDDVDPALHELTKLSARSSKGRALILNAAVSLEQTTLAHIAPHMRHLFAIGPLHAMAPAPASSSSSLWREDDGCLAWLDSQSDRSVVYVSFGSLTVMSHEQFRELLGGLVATGYPFQEQDAGALQEQDAVIMAKGNHRARIVAWAPQRDVLRHRAVGCFLTHAGWNSTLEGVVEGVPMVCWPSFSDQQTNSRLVGAVWRNGLDMKDVCDGAVAERMVREAMESAEIRRAAEALVQQVKRDVAYGGSSEKEFQRLVSLITVLSTPGATELKAACTSATPGFSQQ
ncbi:unnamed protein product [Miscanthus lutarioriparius]|uniref:UDP-glycosyltransferases domain-containing protein n=1 Tax=Miscanthus lutarioriparius TaxID=422564 RepID=A0A811N544_9POAL|nr:unnamed protein product [Miscanthus lutarioriparius]